MMSSSSPAKPITAIFNPTGEIVVQAGHTEVTRLSVTVFNRGNQSAIIQLSLKDCPEPARHWFSPIEQLMALNPGESREVVLQVMIPYGVESKSYDYIITLEPLTAYVGGKITKKEKIRVTPFVQEVQTATDPLFTVEPFSNSVTPLKVTPGGRLEFTVRVYNRSTQVDRFSLTCSDLPPTWYRILYPEGVRLAGLMVQRQALELNPGEQDTISLIITPPVDANAEIYFPTLSLYSATQPSLTLLDIIYFQVDPIDQLEVELVTQVGQVSTQEGEFELRFSNRGNTTRDISIAVNSIDGNSQNPTTTKENCQFNLSVDRVILGPKENQLVTLKVSPPKGRFKRPFYGKTFNFFIDLEDNDNRPLPNDRFQGVLIWSPRPAWQLWLLIFLGMVGIVGFLLLVWWLFFKPKPLPRIVEFSPSAISYQEANNDQVRLNWQITQAKRLTKIKIVGLTPDGKIISEPVIYDLNQGLPKELKPFCTQDKILLCQNVPTDARKAGDYVFEITLNYRNKRGEDTSSLVLRSNAITINPIPIPKIANFTATPLTTQPVSTAQQTPPKALLKWEIENINYVKELRITARSPEGVILIPTMTIPLQSDKPGLGLPNSNCAIDTQQKQTCQSNPLVLQQPGIYIFELTVIPRIDSVNILSTQKANPIEIKPSLPEILEFKIQGVEALAKRQIPIDPNKPLMVSITWKVKPSKNLKVELLPSPGTVTTQGMIQYPLSPTPSTETLTLQVTDEFGQQVKRSTTLETIVSPLATTNGQGTNSAQGNGKGNNPNNTNVPVLNPMIPPPPNPDTATVSPPPKSPPPQPNPLSPAVVGTPPDRTTPQMPPPAELPPRSY